MNRATSTLVVVVSSAGLAACSGGPPDHLSANDEDFCTAVTDGSQTNGIPYLRDMLAELDVAPFAYEPEVVPAIHDAMQSRYIEDGDLARLRDRAADTLSELRFELDLDTTSVDEAKLSKTTSAFDDLAEYCGG